MNAKLKKVIKEIKQYYYIEYPNADNSFRQRAIELDIANMKLAEEVRILKKKLEY